MTRFLLSAGIVMRTAHNVNRWETGPSLAKRVTAVDWAALARSLDDLGYAQVKGLLSVGECQEMAGWYGDARRYRSTVVMARYGFGQGEYKYFAYPLPRLVTALRQQAYPHLAAVANRWGGQMGGGGRNPHTPAPFPAP